MLDCTCTQILNNFASPISCIKFSNCGQYLAIGTVGGVLKVVRLGRGTEVMVVTETSEITALLWHPLRQGSLFVGYNSGLIRLVQVG